MLFMIICRRLVVQIFSGKFLYSPRLLASILSTIVQRSRAHISIRKQVSACRAVEITWTCICLDDSQSNIARPMPPLGLGLPASRIWNLYKHMNWKGPGIHLITRSKWFLCIGRTALPKVKGVNWGGVHASAEAFQARQGRGANWI